MFRKHFTDLQSACALADAIVATVREPLLVLDQELRVVIATRAFYIRFKETPSKTEGRFLYELGDGQWDIPKLRVLLERILPEQDVMNDYEVEHEFPRIGQRTMLLNARKVLYKMDPRSHILLGIEDITERRILERQKDELLEQKDVLIGEMHHRVANSLQIIASIIMMKARTVESDDARRHLHDAHKRVMSIATVQEHLHSSVAVGSIEIIPYLTKLSEALSQSMIGEDRPIKLTVRGSGGVLPCKVAESLGLIATELVINSLKHAFNETVTACEIIITFEMSGTDWKLSIADNGVGKPDGVFAQPKSGLGTGIVTALAKQLDAKVQTISDQNGTEVSITHATFSSRRVEAA